MNVYKTLACHQADAVSAQALKQITEKLGPSLKSLVLSGNCFKGFNSVLNSLMVSGHTQSENELLSLLYHLFLKIGISPNI